MAATTESVVTLTLTVKPPPPLPERWKLTGFSHEAQTRYSSGSKQFQPTELEAAVGDYFEEAFGRVEFYAHAEFSGTEKQFEDRDEVEVSWELICVYDHERQEWRRWKNN